MILALYKLLLAQSNPAKSFINRSVEPHCTHFRDFLLFVNIKKLQEEWVKGQLSRLNDCPFQNWPISVSRFNKFLLVLLPFSHFHTKIMLVLYDMGLSSNVELLLTQETGFFQSHVGISLVSGEYGKSLALIE